MPSSKVQRERPRTAQAGIADHAPYGTWGARSDISRYVGRARFAAIGVCLFLT